MGLQIRVTKRYPEFEESLTIGDITPGEIFSAKSKKERLTGNNFYYVRTPDIKFWKANAVSLQDGSYCIFYHERLYKVNLSAEDVSKLRQLRKRRQI